MFRSSRTRSTYFITSLPLALPHSHHVHVELMKANVSKGGRQNLDRTTFGRARRRSSTRHGRTLLQVQGHSITAHLFSRDDMNGLLIRILVLSLLAVSQAAPIDVNYTAKSIANDAQCCQSCKWPHDKYYSVDAPHGFCGEACIIPALYPIFKNFEKNLTMASSRSEPACARQLLPDGRLFKIYTKTVTHGIPGLLSVTLDLYAPG